MTWWRHALRTSLGLVLLLHLCAAGRASADNRGMVTRVQGDDVVVNLGLQKGMQPGKTLYVYDSQGRPVATVQVTQVDESFSHVQIVSMEPGTALTLGNQVSETAYTPAPPSTKPSPPSAGVATTTVEPASGTLAPAASAAGARTTDALKSFSQVLKQHTQVYSFRGGKGGALKINVFDVLNFASTLGIGPAGANGAILNPWLISTNVYDTYATYQATAKANQRARSYVQIIYWDAPLVAAYADYYLYKENVSDPVRREEMRRNLMTQKGAQTSAVFQVKLRNAGPGVLQISPFDWHCYMIDPSGNRVKAERYDEVLDKALNPGQEIDGYIYFPRRDPMGKSYVADPPTVLIEDVFGERATIKFKSE